MEIDSTRFMAIQIKKIEIDKWCEGCRIGVDPGPSYVMNWIESNCNWFRSIYDGSLCKTCKNWQKCGYNLLKSCADYLHESLAQSSFSEHYTSEKLEFKELPVRVFLDTNDFKIIYCFNASLYRLLCKFDFIRTEIPIQESGSFFSKFFVNTKNLSSNNDVDEILTKIKKGIELHYLDKGQADVDKCKAETICILLNSLKDIKNVAIQIGSLLLIKTTKSNDEITLLTHFLTSDELIYIEKNQHIFKEPSKILFELQKGCTNRN